MLKTLKRVLSWPFWKLNEFFAVEDDPACLWYPPY